MRTALKQTLISFQSRQWGKDNIFALMNSIFKVKYSSKSMELTTKTCCFCIQYFMIKNLLQRKKFNKWQIFGKLELYVWQESELVKAIINNTMQIYGIS